MILDKKDMTEEDIKLTFITPTIKYLNLEM